MVNNMSKYWKQAIGILGTLATIIGITWGAYSFLDSKYALAEEMKLIEKRLDIKILEDNISHLQNRIWSIEDRYQKRSMPDDMKIEYRRSLKEKEDLEKKLDTIYKKD